MKENVSKFFNLASKFVQSDWFIALNALLIFLGWVLNVWVPMLCVAIVINVIPLFFDKETKHLITILSMFGFIMSTSRNDLKPYIPLLSLILVLLAGMIFSVTRYKRDFSLLHPAKIRGFHATLIALIVPMALAGLGSPYEDPLLVVAVFALIAVLAAVYSFFVITNDGEQKKQLPEYMLKVLFASGVVVLLEMIVCLIRAGDINAIIQMAMTKKIHLGWAGPNNMAPTLSLCIPATFYFCIRKNYATPLFAIIGMVEYAMMFLTGCRGAILFTTMAMPAMLLFVAVKSENKISFCATISVLFAVAVVLIAYYGNIIADIMTVMLNKGLDSSGRDSIYEMAIGAFKTWPVFGAGWDYNLNFWFHSTFFQIIASTGIFGLIMFAVFYFWRYRTFFVMRKNTACVALLCGMLLFEAYGMIDTNFFLPTFFTILMLMTFVVEVNVPERKCLAFGGRDPIKDVTNLFHILTDKLKSANYATPEELANKPKKDEAAGNSPQNDGDEEAEESDSPAESDSPDDKSEDGEQGDLSPSLPEEDKNQS